MNVAKYNITDKISKSTLSMDNGIVKLESPKGLTISDYDTKYKFLDLSYNGKEKKGIFDLQNSSFSMNQTFQVKTENNMIHLQNSYDENILDIPISRELKLKPSDITTSSTIPGASYVNCVRGHLRSVCSTNKKNGTKEFVTLTLPLRKIISNIKIYNRIDDSMSKMKGVEVGVYDIDGNETFKTVLDSISDFYNLNVNAFGKTITLRHTIPNTEIGVRNIRIFIRNLI
jgi:hypothetical protein